MRAFPNTRQEENLPELLSRVGVQSLRNESNWTTFIYPASVHIAIQIPSRQGHGIMQLGEQVQDGKELRAEGRTQWLYQLNRSGRLVPIASDKAGQPGEGARAHRSYAELVQTHSPGRAVLE